MQCSKEYTECDQSAISDADAAGRVHTQEDTGVWIHTMRCIAGFFLFAVQPFKLGDHISVSYTSPAAASSASRSAWFEGTCEKVDLRYREAGTVFL